MTYDNPHQSPAPQAGGGPASDKPSGFPVGGILMIIGGLIAGASYLLTWYVLTSDDSITVNGFGQINSDDYELETSRLHWLLLASAVLAIVIGIARLIGAYSPKWNSATIGAIATAVVGAGVSVLLVPDKLDPAVGIWVGALGAVLIVAGALLTKFTRN